MRKAGAGLGVALLALLLPTGLAPADPPSVPASKSRIEFVGTNLVASAEGVFHRWRIVEARVELSQRSESYVEVAVDVARFPTARVRVHQVRVANENVYRARFDIRIRDIEKSLLGEFELVSDSPPTVAGQLTLKRTDFGVGSTPSRWNPMAVDDVVLVRFNAVLETHP